MAKFVVDYSRDGDGEPPGDDGRLYSSAFERNHRPIVAVLEETLAGRSGDLVEFGSGTGQHAAAIARALPQVTVWPSDPNPRHVESCAAWRRFACLANLSEPALHNLLKGESDAAFGGRFEPQSLTAVLAANVIHIAPWPVGEALIRYAARMLDPQGALFIYGPFRRNGEHTSKGNVAFDRDLRAENPAWGVRDTADIATYAAAHGLALAEIHEMPTNNLTLRFTPQHN